MSTEVYEFEGFRLDAANRQLERQGTRIELNSRYLDVLILLVREHGSLVAALGPGNSACEYGQRESCAC